MTESDLDSLVELLFDIPALVLVQGLLEGSEWNGDTGRKINPFWQLPAESGDVLALGANHTVLQAVLQRYTETALRPLREASRTRSQGANLELVHPDCVLSDPLGDIDLQVPFWRNVVIGAVRRKPENSAPKKQASTGLSIGFERGMWSVVVSE